MEELKNKANKLFALGEYKEAIDIYTDILNKDPTNYNVILNRSVVYIKMEKYEEGLEDAVKATKMNPSSAKAWGRVGAALYGLNRLQKALVAYNKANELGPNIIYQNMITDIQKTLTKFNEIKNTAFTNCEFTRLPQNMMFDENILNSLKASGLPVENMFKTMMDTVMSNPKMIETINNPEFQNKVMSFEGNPLNALKDGEVMNFVNDLMKVMKIN
jgi:stress-induced-phosphoprotein 1